MSPQETRERHEKRQMGALGVFHRQSRGVHQILTMKDAIKTETTSGLEKWCQPLAQPWGLPGGGRGNKPDSLGRIYPETIARTLESELKEELGLAINLLRTKLDKQVYPFMVAQLRLSENKTDEFAVTSAWFEFDQLSREQQTFIDQSVAGGEASWQSMAWLSHQFTYLMYCDQDRNRRPVLHLEYRPQVLMAAYLWHLEKVSRMSEPDLIQFLVQQNKKTHAFIYGQAATWSQEGQIHRVNNGTFNPDGTLIPADKMLLRDRRYLLRRPH